MTTRNLDALFSPSSIAVIGASDRANSVGGVLIRNLREGGFDGPIMTVNPHRTLVGGQPCHATIEALPQTPDLAVIATPAPTAPDVLGQLARSGCRSAIIITAGITAATRKTLLEIARPRLMRLLGPNCLGFLSPARGINASFAHRMPPRGRLAFVTQSGAIATAMIDWAIGRGIGFSHLLSLGDMADVDFGDLLDYLALDPETDAILLYAETITQARKFMSAGRIAARNKPVIIVKGGRSGGGAQAAASHTGALAGSDSVHDAAFRRAGMLRVSTLRDLFDVAETLASGVRVHGDRLAILTNGGGLGVLATDALEAGGGSLARLSVSALSCLSAVLPASWSRGNPVDILGDADRRRYAAGLACLADLDQCDAILAINCPTGIADPIDAARAVADCKQRARQTPIIACWAGLATTGPARAVLSAAGVPTYETPDEAVGAFLQLAEYARNQKALYEVPSPPLSAAAWNKNAARRIISSAVADGRTALTDGEVRALLAAYNIPVVETINAVTPFDAGIAAERLGGSVVLKIRSPDISHKTDVGGVRMQLSGQQQVQRVAEDMLIQIHMAMPDARIDGFTIQRMIVRPKAQELILGAAVDPAFGPCLLFGHGGVATEVIADRCMGLPPLNLNLATDMISRTRISRLLAGFRDRRPADIPAIANVLVALSDLVVDFPEIRELDINPLLADSDGIIALDARVILAAPGILRPQSAILPYPHDLIRPIALGGSTGTLRPIRPEDAAALAAMALKTDPHDLRMRFHGTIGSISGARAARLSQIDYDREMVLVAEQSDASLAGVVRLVFDPDFNSAEAAIIVRSDFQGQGLGTLLLDNALAHACQRGATSIWGLIMRENCAIIDLVRRRGAVVTADEADPTLARVELPTA